MQRSGLLNKQRQRSIAPRARPLPPHQVAVRQPPIALQRFGHFNRLHQAQWHPALAMWFGKRLAMPTTLERVEEPSAA